MPDEVLHERGTIGQPGQKLDEAHRTGGIERPRRGVEGSRVLGKEGGKRGGSAAFDQTAEEAGAGIGIRSGHGGRDAIDEPGRRLGIGGAGLDQGGLFAISVLKQQARMSCCGKCASRGSSPRTTLSSTLNPSSVLTIWTWDGGCEGLAASAGVDLDHDRAFPIVAGIQQLEKFLLGIVRVHGDGGTGVRVLGVNDKLVRAADGALLELIPRRARGCGRERGDKQEQRYGPGGPARKQRGGAEDLSRNFTVLREN